MVKRLKLQSKLEELLGSRNVYEQPPESVKLKYPCIIYSKNNMDTKYADNKKYITKDRYEIIVIDRTPDHPVIKKLLELPYCSYDRPYNSDNLHHDVFTLYY